ncbi:MAG: carbonic anhydrase family protein [Burkholderiales bacterium]|nr:carbonic anhydrase family protein [Burkholderiales bacterium]
MMAITSSASLCETGKAQSPINIEGPMHKSAMPLQFDYHASPLKIANDGHTVRVRLASGSQLKIGSQKFRLYQFHFHTSGGDRIGGEEFPMSAHLLHKSDSGQLLALVVLFRVGAKNQALSALMPLIPGRADGDHGHEKISIDPNTLLPESRAYYRYTGSLTSAPCTEGVEWIVMNMPVEISPAQLALYKSKFADNARPVQALNKRIIFENQ